MGVAQLAPEHSKGRPRRTNYSEGCAWVRIRGGFIPDLIVARSGERLRLVFRREETAPCSEQVVIESLGKSVTLPPFEDVPVDLGPLALGEHEFRCELGVLRGRILVRDQPAPRSYASSESGKSKRRLGQMKRPTINITPAERTGRILVGLVGAIGGLLLLASAGGAVIAVLEVLLVLAGLDLVVTGALGHCPLYRKLGHTPRSLRGSA